MTRLLIANRGEVACRIARTARACGMHVIAIHSDPDANALHVREADEAVSLGGTRVGESYTDRAKVLAAIGASKADAVHPGYGLLSEDAAFACGVVEAGATFVGPSATTIEAMGDKMAARATAAAAGLPLLAASERLALGDDAAVDAAVADIGLPVLVKAAGGGGGIGMRIAHSRQEARAAVRSTMAQAGRFFGNGDVYLERYVARARHIEVQVLGDGEGHAIHLFERDCTLQRRFQKVIEEAPAPAVDRKVLTTIAEAAARLAATQRYRGVGTVEFVLDADTGTYAFLEMNTRLQVEHPVTEMVTGLDLVHAQFAAAGLVDGALPAAPRLSGHAIECRLYAERPAKRFLPSAGTLSRFDLPVGPGVRVDAGYAAGDTVSAHYDPLLAKIIVHAEDRPAAIARMDAALARCRVEGVETNRDFLRACLAHPAFGDGHMTTQLLEAEREALVAAAPALVA
ncbi:MAG: biotin carboxylase N-terminal domain-containing protein [Pseudomonadota bacterium]